MSDEVWLTSLITDTPQQGFELALKLSRMGVKYTQPSAEMRDKLRTVYESDADALIASSQVVAINYQTIAAANNYWKYACHLCTGAGLAGFWRGCRKLCIVVAVLVWCIII